MMKQNILFLLLFKTAFNLFGQDVATPKWINVTVDGKKDEWGSLNFYDEQTQLNFGLANDSNDIYLCFQTVDEPTQMKIMRAGMKITLSAKGKSKHEASIVFPIPQGKSQMPVDSSHTLNSTHAEQVFNKQSFRENFIAHHATMQVNGFAHTTGEVPVSNSDVKVAVNWDSSNNLIYEVAINKKEFFGDTYSSKDEEGNISLEVEVNGLPHYDGEKVKAHNSDGMQAGMGDGKQGGSNRGGFNQENMPQQSTSGGNNIPLSAKTSFKQKFVLNNGSN